MVLLVRMHKKEGRTVVAVCDKELLGKLIEDGKRQLDLTSDFYKGVEMPRAELGDLVRNADGVNLVGKEAVQLGLDEGVIEKEQVMLVKGVPHAHAALVQ